jgi:hypothetical protein
MRRSASEIIRYLEMRIARLEKQSKPEIVLLGVVVDKLERQYGLKIKNHIMNGAIKYDLHERVIFPPRDYIRNQLRRNKKIWVESVNGGGWWLAWD